AIPVVAMDRTKSRRVMSLRSVVAIVLRTLLPPGFRLLDVRSTIKCLLRKCGTARRFCNSERVWVVTVNGLMTALKPAACHRPLPGYTDFTASARNSLADQHLACPREAGSVLPLFVACSPY